MSVNTDIKYRNQLLYSVFVRDYGLNGTFQDVEEDLDRIRSLGTDIIWFMPIHPIGKIGRKGSIGSPYAISDYRAVNPDFGTIEEKVRPGTFWLAESVETAFIQRIRGDGEYCLSDSELYQAFDACYDYDIYFELAHYLLGKGPLSKYLDRLNLQECIYPENYVKLHFTENHDRIRTAALVPDLRSRRHLLAFTMFQKGISFIYNGQERSTAAFANIFEREEGNRRGA